MWLKAGGRGGDTGISLPRPLSFSLGLGPATESDGQSATARDRGVIG